ncbi:hypothetical protein AB0425_27730 [Actinosynnema sp. NPDC051121]
MTDLRALRDAFDELERRADAVTAAKPFDHPTRTHASRPGTRLVPIALAAAVVAAVATGAVLLVPDADHATTQVAQSGGSATSAPVVTTTRAPAHGSPEVLAERLRAVLGDLATFTVTESGPGAALLTVPDSPTATPPTGTSPPASTVGSMIGGTLTASGVTGGFDLVVYPGTAGEKAECVPDAPDCTARDLPDGSSLTASRYALEGSGVTNDVRLVRPDGLVFSMHVSNRQSPKGLGPLLGAEPPLTVDQLVGIATSDRW